MGRGIVQSHAAGADLPYYNVELQYELGTLEAQIVELGKRLDKLNQDTIPEAEEAVEAKQSALDAKRIELHEAAQAAKQVQPLDLSEWRAIANEIAKLAGELEGERAKLIAYKSQYLAVLKERDFLQSQVSRWKDPQIQAWCVDYSPEIEAGECATIEIDGEPGQVLIAPGGRAHTGQDGNLTPVVAQNWAQWFLNTTSLPGWQRWMPTYRKAKITDIDYEADTATVCLPVARSSQQNLLINPDDGEACTAGDATPDGYTAFCASNPGHAMCGEHGGGSTTYTPDLYDTLAEINQRVNDNHPYAPDTTTSGQVENWRIAAPGEGADCEDYALEKVEELIAAGIPASAIRLAAGYTGGDGHLWVEVLTDEGAWALDNNYSEPVPADDLPWSARIYSGGEGGAWTQEGHQLSGVPIEYMDCNAEAFNLGDSVVVQLVEQSWSTPKIIGFEFNPKQCGTLRLKLRWQGRILTPNDISQWATAGNPFAFWGEDEARVDDGYVHVDFSGEAPGTTGKIFVGWDADTQEFLVNATSMFGAGRLYYVAIQHLTPIHDVDYFAGMAIRTWGSVLVTTDDWTRNIVENKYHPDSVYFMLPDCRSPYFDRDKPRFHEDLLLRGGESRVIDIPARREWSCSVPLYYVYSYFDAEGALKRGASQLDGVEVAHVLDATNMPQAGAIDYVARAMNQVQGQTNPGTGYPQAEGGGDVEYWGPWLPVEYLDPQYAILGNTLSVDPFYGTWSRRHFLFLPLDSQFSRTISTSPDDTCSYVAYESELSITQRWKYWDFSKSYFGEVYFQVVGGTEGVPSGEIRYRSTAFGFDRTFRTNLATWQEEYAAQFQTITGNADPGGDVSIIVSPTDFNLACNQQWNPGHGCATTWASSNMPLPPPTPCPSVGLLCYNPYRFLRINLNGEYM